MGEAAMEHDVLFSTIATASGHSFGRATLNAPGSLNALSLSMIDRLAPQLAAWARDPHIAGVVLDAAGDKAFCAGGDVVGLYRSIREAAPGQVPAMAAAFFEREYRLDHAIHNYPKPLLCWGHGIVMGGGIGLYAGASHRVATPKTRLAMPEIGIGLYPDVGGSWFLARMPGGIGLFLALTGASLNAADAQYAGLADAILPHDALDSVLERVAAASWHGQGGSALDDQQLSQLLSRFQVADAMPSPLKRNAGLIEELLHGQQLERIAPRLAALATHEDPWLAQAAQSFVRGSPTSARLALEMQQRAKGATLADAFRLEYQASVGCCMQHDFAEGVRALLIDKDKSPRWQPAMLEQVGPDLIEAHLRPHYNGAHPLADLT
jgi:enoyl-CoA hydratase/carnithine racemase